MVVVSGNWLLHIDLCTLLVALKVNKAKGILKKVPKRMSFRDWLIFLVKKALMDWKIVIPLHERKYCGCRLAN